MKKRDFYILVLLILLVSYATYYRSQVCANEQPVSQKAEIETAEQTRVISIQKSYNVCDSIASIVEDKEGKPST